MNTNFKAIGLTRLGIKPESTAPEAEALITRPSKLLNKRKLRFFVTMFYAIAETILNLYLNVKAENKLDKVLMQL